MVRFSLLAFIAAVQAASLEIFATNVHTGDRSDLGVLSFSPESANFSVRATLAAGDYCLGTDVAECFSYSEVKEGLSGEFVVYMDGPEVENLAFVAGTNGLSLRVEHVAAAPVPNLQPPQEEVKQNMVKQKVMKKKTVKTDDGETVEVEEEVEEEVVDNRSWVQRNWMYIVPPLVLLLLIPDQEGEKKE